MRLIIFEDEKCENFYPLTLLRPVFELRCGYTTLLSKILGAFERMKTGFFIRDHLSPTFRKRTPSGIINDKEILSGDDLLIVNGRWLITDTVKIGYTDEVGISNGSVAYLKISKEKASTISAEDFPSFLATARGKVREKKIPARLIDYPWELIRYNREVMESEFALLKKSGMEGKVSSLVAIYGSEKNLYVARTAELHPFVVIDTTNGSVVIDEKAIILPHSRIEGPVYIGEGTHIYSGNIHAGTSIGPFCRIGGEVEDSIIQGYANKYHSGFLGHSYLGEWVNIGAMATTSNIRNDYSTVKVYIKGNLIDTGEIKVGSFIGDHTKTSIGTLFNTGTVAGVMSNIISVGGLLPRFIPSFCSFLDGKASRGRGFDALVETARRVMSRRGKVLSEEDKNLLKAVYELTAEERSQEDCAGPTR
jgi:UDP-N-acetylglucosamine diphosphorylase/glucosamine-1-phosphate N-acetyltransferase